MKGFIEMMEEYVGLLSDVDPLFVKFLSAQMLGHALTKKSYININPEFERFNLYTLLVAPSYFGRKTAIQDMMSRFYPQEVMLPNESSAEKFIANLAERPDGVWFYGEFSKILKHIKKGGYMSTIAETLNDLYKYERRVYKRELMKEEYEIINPYPTFSSTLTPEVLQENVTPEMMDGGLFGRLIIIPGRSGSGGRKPITKQAMDLENDLKKVSKKLAKANLHIRFDISSEGFKRIDEIEKELLNREKVSAIAGRYGQATIRLSGIIAFSECVGSYICKNSKKSKNSNISNNARTKLTNIANLTKISNLTNLTIEPKHIDKAYDMLKPCLEMAENLYDYSVMNKKHIIKVREYIKENFPVARSKVMQYCNLDKRQTDEAEETLVDQEIIDKRWYKKRKSNGAYTKSKVFYCMHDYDTEDGEKCETCDFKEACDFFERQKGKK
jgi:hypothetical protein